jgi:bacillithiol biosynthesis cysteine-adding enzyme BshC
VPTGAAAARLDRASREGVVVTTGQQPGLFGGPLMTFAKALSVRAFADTLESLTGVPVAPVFWAATDDADFDEAAVVAISDAAGAKVLRLERTAPLGTPMSRVPLSANVEAYSRRLQDACGSLVDPRPLELALLEYGYGATIGGAYVGLLRQLLAPLGIAVLDASHPAVARAAQPLLQQAAASASRVGAAVHARNEEIIGAGFEPQVEEVPGLSLLFTNRDGVKRRLSLSEAESVIDLDGAALSPTVLLRPIVERTILPSAFYVGGPSEFAYFAQLNAVADALGAPPPLVQARWSVMIVEPRIQRQLDEFGVDRTGLRDPHSLEGEVARRHLPSALGDAMQRLRDDIRRDVAAARSANSGFVPDAVLDGLSRSLAHRLERTERRILAAVKRRETELMRRIAALRGALYPLGAPQERKLSYIPFLARYGPDLVEDMLTQAAAYARVHVAEAPASPAPQAPAPARA